MAWERFQYLCRAALIQNGSSPLSDCIDQINAKPSAELYGKLPNNSLPMSLLYSAKNLENTKAKVALKTYARLDPTFLVEKPRNMKRLPIYLLWVVTVYVLAVLTYEFKIFPMFESIYDKDYWGVPADAQFFMEYGPIIALFLGLFIVLLVAAVFGLNQLVSFKKDYSENTVFKRLCPGFIKKPYLKLIGLLLYPIRTNEENNDELDSNIRAHFESIETSGMELEKEICALFKAEDAMLVQRCEIIAKAISIIVALIVFFSVYKFVYGFYLPIFFYGVSL